MSRSLDETAGDFLDEYPEAVRLYWDGGFRHYVHEVLLEAKDVGPQIPHEQFEKMVQEGKARYELDVARGLASPPPTTPELVDRMRRGPEHAPVVYYMRLGEFVKIGTSINIRNRYDSIHPQGVMAVELGSYELERQRHRQFVDLHSHGEWFILAPTLADHIVTIRAEFRSCGMGTDEWLALRLPPTNRQILP